MITRWIALCQKSRYCKLIRRLVLLFRTVCCFLNLVLLNFFNSSFQLDQKAKAQLVDGFDLYYDMSYTVAYSTFANIMNGNCCCNPRTLFNYANKFLWIVPIQLLYFLVTLFSCLNSLQIVDLR
jgi:hypothetical protein